MATGEKDTDQGAPTAPPPAAPAWLAEESTGALRSSAEAASGFGSNGPRLAAAPRPSRSGQSRERAVGECGASERSVWKPGGSPPRRRLERDRRSWRSGERARDGHSGEQPEGGAVAARPKAREFRSQGRKGWRGNAAAQLASGARGTGREKHDLPGFLLTSPDSPVLPRFPFIPQEPPLPVADSSAGLPRSPLRPRSPRLRSATWPGRRQHRPAMPSLPQRPQRLPELVSKQS